MEIQHESTAEFTLVRTIVSWIRSCENYLQLEKMKVIVDDRLPDHPENEKLHKQISQKQKSLGGNQGLDKIDMQSIYNH